MALYRHFDNKRELLSEMLDVFIQEADVLPGRKMSWDKWLLYVSDQMYQALLKQPSWIPLLSEIPLRQSGLKVMNECLKVLTETGFSRRQALEGFLGMIHILLGAALMSCQLSKRNSRKVVHTLTDDIYNKYPNIEESMKNIQSLSKQTLIQPGMKLLIAGMKKNIKPMN
jgi:hypothetical protein